MRMKRTMEELYERESAEHESKTKMLSIAVPVDEASMLRAIADRFGQSLSAFAGEILEEATREAFIYLSEEDKRELAQKADADPHQYLEKQGVVVDWTNSDTMNGKYGRWQIIASNWINGGLTPDDVASDGEQSE